MRAVQSLKDMPIFWRLGGIFLLALCCLCHSADVQASSHKESSGHASQKNRTKVRYKRGEGFNIDVNGDGLFVLSLNGISFVRFEAQDNRSDMSFSRDDRDGYIATRMRLGFGLEMLRVIGLHMAVQDARFWGSGLPSNGHVRFHDDTNATFGREVFLGLSLFEGYISFDQPWNLPFRLEIGRMALEYGRGYILGDPAYAVQGQSFDTIRLRWFLHNWNVDLFWSKIRATVDTTQSTSCTQDCTFEGDELAAIYAMGKLAPGVKLDLYGMYYHRAPHKGEAPSNSDLGILGARLDWHSAIHKLGLELVGEAGRWMNQTAVGFSMLMNLAFTLPGRFKPTLGMQMLLGSGDTDTTDDVSTSYKPLFSRRRRFYGALGLFAATNLIQPMLFFALHPVSSVQLALSARYNLLWSPTDAILSGGHTFYARNPNGTSNALGAECSFSVMWKPFPYISFDAVGGVFLPQSGSFFAQISTSKDVTVRGVFGNEPAFLGYLRAWLSF